MSKPEKQKVNKMEYKKSIPWFEIPLFVGLGYFFSSGIMLVSILLVIVMFGDALLARFNFFKKHANLFPQTLKESIFMNGLLLLLYYLGFAIQTIT